jgi:hypothetical protein
MLEESCGGTTIKVVWRALDRAWLWSVLFFFLALYAVFLHMGHFWWWWWWWLRFPTL